MEFMGVNLTEIVLYHGLILLGELMIALMFLHMLYRRRTPTSMISWLLFMILLPYVAIFFYIIFGRRKRKNRYQKEYVKLREEKSPLLESNPISQVLRSYNIAGESLNEGFELYTDATEAYASFMTCIEEAKESIYISTYVFKYDEVTKEIIQALSLKAKDGLDVKILIDSLGSLGVYFFPYKLKGLKSAGVKVEFFMPIFKMPFRSYINLRNHRKIFLFDQAKVLTGGMNLSKEYLGPQVDTSRWEDLLFLLKGPAVKQYFELFASDWFYASEQRLHYDKEDDTKSTKGTSVQVVPSGPDMEDDALYEALLSAIYSSKERIWIVTPYFVPHLSLVEALRIAQHKGLDVKIITPKKSNHLIADLVRSSYMRELEEIGVEIALYKGNMLHAKAVLFDDTGVMLGSVNLDNRSLFLNYEVASFIYSNKVIKDVEKWMQGLLSSSCSKDEKISSFRRIMENFMRIFAPQL